MDQLLQLQDPLLRHVLAVWQAAGAGAVPDYRALDPVALGRTLPHVWLCEREAGSGRFRYHLAGERINEVYRRSLAGRYLDEIIPPDGLAVVQRRYDAVLDTPAAVRTAGLVYLRNQRTFSGERLVLPLLGAGGRPERVLGATVYALLPGSRPPEPEQVTRVVRILPLEGERGWIEDRTGERVGTL
ncbi:MAG: PAS domain-containing protein [Tistlia sp.]|uniref:PAS domain-containing protein n=1 Tax=Tistlia sp. TaxID=3057121 RepID=UPI0034A48570